MALPNMGFWDWLVHTGLIQGDPSYYSGGQASQSEFQHAIQTATNNLAFASDPRVAGQFWEYLVSLGAIQGDPTYYSGGQASPQEVAHALTVASQFFVENPTGGGGAGNTPGGTVTAGNITDVAPVATASGSTIPQGARLVKVTNPQGSDAAELFYLVYDWRGVQLAYEVGDRSRFEELFGGVENFSSFTTLSQAGYDNQGFTQVGSVDQILGSSESLGSQIEREVRALGLEDLPSWLSNSPDALALVAEATAQEWSPGRLWTELSNTQAFTDRFGGAIDVYLQGGVTIQEAVDSLLSDENALRNAIRRLQPTGFEVSPEYLQGLLANGWTPTSAAQVLEQAQILRSDPMMLDQANAVLTASGLETLDEVGFINALNGYGPLETVEALNTAAAGIALREAGLEDVDIDLLMEVVDTSDRLLTVDSFSQLAQQLAFNTIRFGKELDTSKLGISRDDLIAAAFGESNPNGKTPGEVLNLLARFERDRQKAGAGFEDFSAFQNDKGRLVVQGLRGL